MLVTAAAGTGIGFATAKRALEEGARVVRSATSTSGASPRRPSGCARSARTQADGKLCDVTREADVQALVRAAIADAWAGSTCWSTTPASAATRSRDEMTDEQWRKVLDVTLTGTFRMTRAMLPHMYAGGRGAIVNNASVLGWRAQAGQAHYAAAKAGVMALTRCAAIEAAEHGVRVNAVAPELAMHAFLAKVTSDELLDELTEPRGLRARRRAVGGRQRDRVPGQRLLRRT